MSNQVCEEVSLRASRWLMDRERNCLSEGVSDYVSIWESKYLNMWLITWVFEQVTEYVNEGVIAWIIEQVSEYVSEWVITRVFEQVSEYVNESDYVSIWVNEWVFSEWVITRVFVSEQVSG